MPTGDAIHRATKPPDGDDGCRPDALAWAALLARWLEVARASRVLPDRGDAGRWKRAVVPMIELHATLLALRDLSSLEPSHRPHARALAELRIDASREMLVRIWRGHSRPAELVELAADADRALRASHYAGLLKAVWRGPGPYEVPEVRCEPLGTLAIMPPGSIAMPGEPVAWWTEREPLDVPGCEVAPAPAPRQVYRQFDEEGRVTRDVVANLLDDPLPGLPMLVPIALGGVPIGRFLRGRDEWNRLQRSGFAGAPALAVPVVDASTPEA